MNTGSDNPFRAVVPEVGLQFKSFRDVESLMEDYGESIREVFTMQRSCYLPSGESGAKYNTDLKYLWVYYTCKYGGTAYRTDSETNRKTSTYKIQCPAQVVFRVSRDKQFLEIKKTCLSHEGHADSKAFYKYIPEVRRLAPEERQMAVEALELRCNKKMLQTKLMNEFDKFVTLKDLSNIQATLRRTDDLTEMISELEKRGATSRVFCENDKFKGIYFSTPDMRRSMHAWPEIVLIDGTYKLLSINLTVMLLLVEDSNASTEIVAVALLVREDYKTFKWFLESFKSENAAACLRINCIMGDKDLLERDVLKEVFPNVPIYICLFHTLRTFSREISRDKMNISRSERVECLRMLEKLAYSFSAQEYDENYIKFCEIAPKSVQDYFNKNWHIIRNEWTIYSMSSGNLHNRTNNRTESTNAKIKQVVKKCSSLVDFVHAFFAYLQSHSLEVNFKTSKSFTRQRVTNYPIGSSEREYMDYLTLEAFFYVEKEIGSHQNIVVERDDGEECLIQSRKGMIHATVSSCECNTWTSSLLPCRHIFAVRKHFDFPLFSRILCNVRWTKEYCKKTQRSFSTLKKNDETESIKQISLINRVISQKSVNTKEKQKELDSSLKDLMFVGSLSCGASFHYKVSVLKEIEKVWEHGSEVSVHKVEDTIHQFSGRDELALNCLDDNTRKKGPTLGVSRKRQILSPLIHDLQKNALVFTETKLQRAIDTIKKIESFWRQQLEISIKEESVTSSCGDRLVSSESPNQHEIHQTIQERLQRLRLESKTANDDLSRVEMPTPIIMKGRPRQSLDTWIRPAKGKVPKRLMKQIRSTIIQSSNVPTQNLPETEELTSDDLARIKMPMSVISKGRPRGSKLTAIGLPRRKILTKFSEKTDFVKSRDMIRWLRLSEKTLEDVLKRRVQITQNDFDMTPTNLKDSLADDEVNITLVKDFFEKKTFKQFQKNIDAKRKLKIISCEICLKRFIGISMRCDSCLARFHCKCASVKRASSKKPWFCQNCLNN